MYGVITYYMLLLYYTSYYMIYCVFTVGIALIGVMPDDGGGALVSVNALTDYSYVNNRDGETFGVRLAHCVTGLGPSGSDNNSALGGVYFNGNRIPFALCNDSFPAIVQPMTAYNFAGVINILQCATFNVAVEGIYTCEMVNSSMMSQSVRFGVYFTGRSELHNFLINQ